MVILGDVPYEEPSLGRPCRGRNVFEGNVQIGAEHILAANLTVQSRQGFGRASRMRAKDFLCQLAQQP